MNQGERAARERVEAVYAAVDALDLDRLTFSTVPRRDLEERSVLLADLERAADRVGRGELLDEARGQLREALARRTGSRTFRAETGVGGVSAIGRSEDIAAVTLALEDAVSVAVVEDYLDLDEASALAEPGRRVLGLPPLVDEPAAEDPDAWQPSADDWAAAARGPAAVDPDLPMAGGRALQTWLFSAIGVVGVLVAIAVGLTGGEWPLAILGAAAVAGLAFTFATYHRPITRP